MNKFACFWTLMLLCPCALLLLFLMLLCNLKKQSQFVPGLIDVMSYMKGVYDIIPLCGTQENKANQSQFPAAEGTKGAKKTSEVWGRRSDFGYLSSVFCHLSMLQIPISWLKLELATVLLRLVGNTYNESIALHSNPVQCQLMMFTMVIRKKSWRIGQSWKEKRSLKGKYTIVQWQSKLKSSLNRKFFI